MDKNDEKGKNDKPEEIKFNIKPFKGDELDDIFEDNSIIIVNQPPKKETDKKQDKKII